MGAGHGDPFGGSGDIDELVYPVIGAEPVLLSAEYQDGHPKAGHLLLEAVAKVDPEQVRDATGAGAFPLGCVALLESG